MRVMSQQWFRPVALAQWPPLAIVMSDYHRVFNHTTCPCQLEVSVCVFAIGVVGD